MAEKSLVSAGKNRLQDVLLGVPGTQLDGWQADSAERQETEDVYYVNA